MRSLKNFIVAATIAVALSASGAMAESFEIVPVWFHIHSLFKGDDGGETPANIVSLFEKKGAKGVFFTPHSATIDFTAFRTGIDSLTRPDFVTVAGREISLGTRGDGEGRVMCHINAFSETSSPEVLDGKYLADDLPKLIADLDREGAFYVWNHPWICTRWKDKAGMFDGIEMFNDFGPGYVDGSSYEFNKSAYLEALAGGRRLFVVSGIDMHSPAQTSLGDFITFFLPDEFTKQSMLKATRSGHSVAAFNARLLEISDRPALADRSVPDGSFKIAGKAALKIGGPKPGFVVYLNGKRLDAPDAISFTKGKRTGGSFFEYDFSFGGNVAQGKTDCYVFEIPHYMISSPYCFRNGG